MRIVGGDQRQADSIRKIDCQIHAVFLNLEARVLDLHIEAVAEDTRIPFDEFFRFVVVFGLFPLVTG